MIMELSVMSDNGIVSDVRDNGIVSDRNNIIVSLVSNKLLTIITLCE